MAVWVSDPWSHGAGGFFADQVEVSDRPAESKLLGPDGRPLKYERPVVGFDLRPALQRKKV